MVKNNLWGGRFKKGPSAELVALSVSTQFDFVLAPYDIAGSIAHANALQKADLLSETEHKQITDALKQMRDELTDAENPLTYNESDEDVHSALERILIERVGVETGGKLRAGRSRNDQIATFVRMYLRDSAASIKALLAEYCGAISARAEEVFADKAVVAGRTHMQHAQPVLLAHQLMAHAWPMLRNIDRLNDFVTRLGGSPYGSGALAGNTFGMDADAIAKELGFEMPEFNSIDATASRDLVAEMLYILAQISIDMSRFAEEIIIWNTKEFDYITLADEYSTGSSIMPQKKNPDIAELTRGKTGRMIGNLTAILTTLKGIPLAYNRDLQEDKEPLFDSVQTLETLIPAFNGMVKTLHFNYENIEKWAPLGHALATDLAEELVKIGVPFKFAHEISGGATAIADEKNVELWDLDPYDVEDLVDHIYGAAGLDNDVVDNTAASKILLELTVENAIDNRNSPMGTAPASVNAQMKKFGDLLRKLG